MESVPNARQAFSPLDEELGLQPGRLTPLQLEHLTHLSLWMPFGKAVKVLTDVTGVQASEATARRQTQAAGAVYEQWQNEQAAQLCDKQSSDSAVAPMAGEPASQSKTEQPKKAEARDQKLLISSDGAMIRLVAGEYVEAKTLVIGHVHSKEKHSTQRPDQQVETVEISFFSRVADAQTFSKLATVETERRGVSVARQVCAVQDGAEWIQGFVDLHAHDAVRILDFAHAKSYLTQIAELVRGVGDELPANWVSQQCHHLKHDGPAAVLKDLSLLLDRHAQMPDLQTKVNYLRKREQQMQYPRYQQWGWPIGSGSVESSHKYVVQARLKGAGMRWERSHVNPMLALRTQVCHDRWDEAWVRTCERRGQQRMQKRISRQELRLDHAKLQLQQLILRMILLASPPLPKPVPPKPVSYSSLSASPRSRQPAPNHPWRRPFLAKK